MTLLPSKPPCLRDDALAVLGRLRAHGHAAYFAGGCVRDLLLGLEPKDWDVATDAPPRRVRQLFSNTQAVGQLFGVILVKHGRSMIEVATFRSEGSYSDGRRPDSVQFTTAQEDAGRRDFTINGLFLDPTVAREEKRERSLFSPASVSGAGDAALRPVLHPTFHGTIIDYVGGVADLNARVLRAIGDPARRFAEDHLRLLRAVRFSARFDFTIERATADAIRTNAPRLRAISPERIADELRRMLPPATRNRAWPMLWEFALIDIIFRFFPSQEGTDFNPDASIFLKVAAGEEISFGLALAAGSLDYRMQSASPPRDPAGYCARQEIHRAGRALRDALKISNDELEEVAGILEPLPTLLARDWPGVAQKKRFLARRTAPESLLLLDALAALGVHAERVKKLRPELDELSRGEVSPIPLITGDDLTAAGFRPGPVFKRLLDSAYDAQLEGRIATKEEAMELVRRMEK